MVKKKVFNLLGFHSHTQEQAQEARVIPYFAHPDTTEDSLNSRPGSQAKSFRHLSATSRGVRSAVTSADSAASAVPYPSREDEYGVPIIHVSSSDSVSTAACEWRLLNF